MMVASSLATVLLALTASSSAAAAGNWSTAFSGHIFDGGCPDLQNLVKQNHASCEAACDAKATCNAINISPFGACALRACPCGAELTPNGALKDFSSYRRRDRCPPAPPPPLFAHVFGSAMVLQRAPLRARLFGKVPPGAALTVTVAQGKAFRFNVSATADAAGDWACLLPAMPASGAGKNYSLTASLDTAMVGEEQQQQHLTDVVWGDVFVCGGQSNMQLPLSLVNNNSAELIAASEFPWVLGVDGKVVLKDALPVYFFSDSPYKIYRVA
jgi:hypothetical protein